MNQDIIKVGNDFEKVDTSDPRSLIRWGEKRRGESQFEVYYYDVSSKSWKTIQIYEVHGYAYVEALNAYLVWGHEQVQIYDNKFNIIVDHYTR